ncbi:uncharacterized protein LOC114357666 [Ostrinia furnacalis]|uniref:uncharacterized protein LOC114357666 n=1 Tax=Ostrinia furnacalis TaxID=93504 RepID=UPI00103D4507|nr:uncharacterized protein LOC114357666 [Ostrinia furnacalis]
MTTKSPTFRLTNLQSPSLCYSPYDVHEAVSFQVSNQLSTCCLHQEKDSRTGDHYVWVLRRSARRRCNGSQYLHCSSRCSPGILLIGIFILHRKTTHNVSTSVISTSSFEGFVGVLITPDRIHPNDEH